MPISQDLQDTLPERLGRYRLVRLVSTGGMARVYEGRRESLAGVSPRVAVKVILPGYDTDAAIQSLFVNEARVGAQLEHQNLVQIQDFDQEGDRFYLVMEFVDGVTLRRIIGACRRHGRPMPLNVVAEIGRQACEGLAYAHEATAEDGGPLRLVHRDIKPSNLMVNTQGIVKILDFGVSRALFSREKSGSVKGTWGYMAPEQAGGLEVGPAADLFSLAAVLYELVELQPLFPEKDPADARKALAEDEGARRASALTGDRGALAPLLIRALQRDPEARFPSAAAMGRALSAFIPDPIRAREEVVRFRDALLTLEEETPEGSVPPSRPRTHPPGSSAHGATPVPGLKVAVGGAPADVQVLPPKRGPRVVLALVALVALGILGFAAWRAFQPVEPDVAALPRGARVESPTPLETEGPPPERTLTAPIAASDPPDPEAEPATAPEGPAEAEPTSEAPGPVAAAETGLVTLSSTPRARVLLDGRFLRWAPVFQYTVPAGEHTVELEAEDGRRTSFSLTVVAGEEIRKVWSFDAAGWVGE